MILSDRSIKKYLESGELSISPLEPDQIQPASVDIRLGRSYLRLDENNFGSMTMTDQIKYTQIECDELIIPSNSFLLATTMEYIRLPNNLTAFVEGRSSVGRMGLFIQNAGWVDPGFEGEITLELYNANRLPIKLEAGRRICQLVFAAMDTEAENPYCGKYQKQRHAVGSRICLDAENVNRK
ncbi:MAG: dCTP deaminase [Eubacteriaceae bacterium]|jgi:dCTP deaminase